MKDLDATSNLQLFLQLTDDELNSLLAGSQLVIIQVRDEVGFPQASLTDPVDLQGYVQGFLDAHADPDLSPTQIPTSTPTRAKGSGNDCEDAVYADDFEFDFRDNTVLVEMGDDAQDALDCGCLLLIGKTPGTDEVEAYIAEFRGVLELLTIPTNEAKTSEA